MAIRQDVGLKMIKIDVVRTGSKEMQNPNNLRGESEAELGEDLHHSLLSDDGG